MSRLEWQDIPVPLVRLVLNKDETQTDQEFRIATSRKAEGGRLYGVLEKQFEHYHKEAASGYCTKHNLLRLLETRLPNVV